MGNGHVCGSRCSAYCERSDRVGCLLRTALRSELGEQMRSSGAWNRLTTPAGRSWWVLGLSELRIGESESGSWATPVSQDIKERNTQYRQGGESLTSQVTWPTPVSVDAKGTGSSGYRTLSGRHDGVTLTDMATDCPGSGPLDRWNPNIPTSRRVRLSARWVAVLMGFPEDWLSADGSERSRRSVQQWYHRSRKQSGEQSSPSSGHYLGLDRT